MLHKKRKTVTHIYLWWPWDDVVCYSRTSCISKGMFLLFQFVAYSKVSVTAYVQLIKPLCSKPLFCVPQTTTAVYQIDHEERRQQQPLRQRDQSHELYIQYSQVAPLPPHYRIIFHSYFIQVIADIKSL